MSNNDNITFGKDNNKVRNCFLELFSKLFEQNNCDYEKTLTKIVDILGNPTLGFQKQRIIIMSYLLAKSLELNHFRKQMGVFKKDSRDESYDFVTKLENRNGLIGVNSDNFKVLINDTLYSILSTNKLYKQDAIKSSLDGSFNKSLYKISPVLLLEHMNTLLEEVSGKELLLEAVDEAVTISFDKRLFASDMHPSSLSKIDFMKKIRFPSAFHQEVLQEFNKRLEIEEHEDEKKVLMCEMLYTILKKREQAAKLSFTEYNLLNELKKVDKTETGLSNFYNIHGTEIINFFMMNINAFDQFKKEGILEDQPEFSKAKRKKS